LRLYDQDDAEYLQINCNSGYGDIQTVGTSPQALRLQDGAAAGVNLYGSSAEGETQELKIFGYRTGDSKRSLDIGVGVDAADQASFDGLSTYYFDGLVKGLSGRLGGDADHVALGTGGDVTFVGGAGLPFGSMYNHDTSTTVTIGVAGTAYRIPSGFTVGQVHNATFQNSREIAVTYAGKYRITWQISFTCAAGNQEIEGFVMINNAMNTQATAHRRIGTATDTGSMSGTCILDLSASDVVALGVLNETGVNDVDIEHANMSLTMVGG
jgi:hypothetical protein